jgi:L-serine deaminase
MPARPEGVITAPLEDAVGIGGDEVGGTEGVGVEIGGAALALAGLAGPSGRLSSHI